MPDQYPDWAAAVGGPGRGDDRRLRVVIAGSRLVPRMMAPRLLIRFIASLPPDAIVLLRSGLRETGLFESEVAALCRIARIATQLCTPWPIEQPDTTVRYVGREGVLHRDNVMVALADVVLAFITDKETESEEFSGTRHVVDAALAKDIPVFLYAVAEDGTVDRVGEHDPDEAWTHRVPSPA